MSIKRTKTGGREIVGGANDFMAYGGISESVSLSRAKRGKSWDP
jgi:hypothetical protein